MQSALLHFYAAGKCVCVCVCVGRGGGGGGGIAVMDCNISSSMVMH